MAEIKRKRASYEYSLMDLAVEYNVSKSTIRHHTRHVPEPPGGWDDGRTNWDWIKRLAAQGKGRNAIARRTGISKVTVWKVRSGRLGCVK